MHERLWTLEDEIAAVQTVTYNAQQICDQLAEFTRLPDPHRWGAAARGRFSSKPPPYAAGSQGQPCRAPWPCAYLARLFDQSPRIEH